MIPGQGHVLGSALDEADEAAGIVAAARRTLRCSLDEDLTSACVLERHRASGFTDAVLETTLVVSTLNPALLPPACGTPVSADVPASSAYCRWIEELFRRGVVAGCGGGNYCPADAVTREQMAVFLAATFSLLLYPA